MTRPISVDQLSDQALLHETVRLAARERGATVELVSALVEIDARRLYLGVGCSSLFVYCTRVLHLSEHAAYGRIETARAARKFPQVLELLAEGALTLTAVTLLAPHLTSENATQVLASVRFKTKRDVEEVVATIRPRPDVVVSVRRLPPPRVEVTRAHALQAGRVTKEDAAAQRAAASPPTEPRQVVAPTAPQRYKVQLTIGRDTHDKLRRAQDLLRHSIPNGHRLPVHGMSLQPFAVKFGRVTKDGAPSWGQEAAVRSEASWSFITSYHMPLEGWPMWQTSSCVVGRTTRSRRIDSLRAMP